MSHLRRAAVASLIALSVFSCASVSGPSGEPRFNPRAVSSRSSLASAAVQAAAYIDSFEERMSLYEEVIRLVADRGDIGGAEAVVDYVTALLESRDSQRPEDFLIVARGYLLVDRPDEAGRALESFYNTVRRVSSFQEKADLLRSAADIAFAGGEDTYDTLQGLVNAVLVTENLSVRVGLLSDVARGYQAQGAGPAAFTLAQQAIPAAESLDDPWLRGVAYSDVAFIFAAASDPTSSTRYLRRVLREMELGRAAIGGEEAQEGLRAVENMLLLEAPLEALRIAELLPGGSIRARGFADVAVHYARADNRPTAFVTFSRAVRETSQEVNPLERAAALRYIAERYIEIDEGQLAELQAMAAVDALRLASGDASKPDILIRLLSIYGRDGELSEADSLAAVLEEPAFKAQLLAHAAAESLDIDRPGDARRYLEMAREHLEGVDGVDAGTAAPMAGCLASLSGPIVALDFLFGLESTTAIAEGLAAMAGRHPPEEELSDEATLRLEELLAEVRVRSLPSFAR